MTVPLPYLPERLRDYLMPVELMLVRKLLNEYGDACAAEAAAQEREACAKIAETLTVHGSYEAGYAMAAAIRARGTE